MCDYWIGIDRSPSSSGVNSPDRRSSGFSVCDALSLFRTIPGYWSPSSLLEIFNFRRQYSESIEVAAIDGHGVIFRSPL